MGDGKRYERKTIKVVRGTDRIVVAKWEQRGWELIDQSPGAVRTELTFRRSKPLLPIPAVAFVALAVGLAGVIVVGSLTERDDSGEQRRTSTAGSPTASHRDSPEVVKNGRYSSEELVVTAARAGFACPSPQQSGASLESAPKYITNCSNGRTLITLGGTITGANAGKVFVLGLDDLDFGNGPWLVGPNWALNGPGVAKLQPVMGGELVRAAPAGQG